MKFNKNSIYYNLKIILKLSKRDFFSSSSGSALGSIWLFIDPLVYIAITLVFFQYALKSNAEQNIPYALWVLPEIIFWTYISTTMASMTNIFREYSFLMRHSKFKGWLIPIIRIIPNTIFHIAIISVALIVLSIKFDVQYSIKLIGIFFYIGIAAIFLYAFGLFVGTLGVFIKDIKNIVGIILQVGFWISPIFWEADQFPNIVKIIMQSNPLYMPISGYRKITLGGDIVFPSILYIFTITMMLLFSFVIYKKLHKNFGDYL